MFDKNIKNRHLVRPFSALRPVPDLAHTVIAPPYDVLSTAEAMKLAKNNPWSFLHISKPEIDLPPGTDIYADVVYKKAKENFDRMIAEGVLKKDIADYYYIYRLTIGTHSQTGIVAAGCLEAYEKNRIRRHELTRPDKEIDRTRQIDAINGQTGPVFTIHKSNAKLSKIVDKIVSSAAEYRIEGQGGVEHALWVVKNQADIEDITQIFDDIGVIYIADGHHRSAAASRVSKIRNQTNKDTSSNLYNSILLVSFPDTEVKIYEYNRVIKDLNGLTEAEFIEKIQSAFNIEYLEHGEKPSLPNSFTMYLSGRWYSLLAKSSKESVVSPVDALDVSILSDRLLDPILNIVDPRVDPRIDFVGGIRSIAELELMVDSGNWAVAFVMYPTSLQDLMMVADAEEVMPPKSTWFEPKLADGLVSLIFE